MNIYAINGMLLMGVLALGMIPMTSPQSVHMLDVGQGDSILFQEKNTQVLVDGGPGSDVLTRLAQEMPWFDRKIEVVVATHFDRDHLEGLTHVLHAYDVGMVLMPSYVASTTQIKEQFLAVLKEKNIPYRLAWYGQSIRIESLLLRVMSPIPGAQWERLSRSNSNNASIIMRADMKPNDTTPLSILLTGDAESGIEKQLLTSVPSEAFDVDILKVGHHGSKTSTTSPFFSAASPVASFISVGADNTYGHPTDEVLARLKNTRIFRTDEQGTVSLFSSVYGWRLSCSGKTHLPFSQDLCIKK